MTTVLKQLPNLLVKTNINDNVMQAKPVSLVFTATIPVGNV